MVVLDLKSYTELTDDIEIKLDEADRAAETDGTRLSHEDVFAAFKS